jgi:hypothetical protein
MTNAARFCILGTTIVVSLFFITVVITLGLLGEMMGERFALKV